MRFVSFVVGLVLWAIPSVAFAAWRLEVHDLKTTEVRTFSPPADSDFVVPMSLGGWRCITLAATKQRTHTVMTMTCVLGEAQINISAVDARNGEVVIRLSKSTKKAGFMLALDWKPDD